MTRREKAIATASTLAQQIFESTVNGICGSTSYYAERNGDITHDDHIGPYERESVYFGLPEHSAFLADLGSRGNTSGLPPYEIYEMGNAADIQPYRAGRHFGEYDSASNSYWNGEDWRILADKILQWHDVCDENPADVLIKAIQELEFGFFDDEI